MKSRAEKGFSLMELVVAVGILMVVMAIAFKLASKSQTSANANQVLAQAHENAEFALSRVSEIIRSAGSNPTSVSTQNPLNFFVSGSVSSVRILSDLNGDGDESDTVTNSSGATTGSGTT